MTVPHSTSAQSPALSGWTNNWTWNQAFTGGAEWDGCSQLAVTIGGCMNEATAPDCHSLCDDPGIIGREVINKTKYYPIDTATEVEIGPAGPLTVEVDEVSGRTVVSLAREENDWDILEAVLQDEGDTLIVRSMDKYVVKAAIEAEMIDGDIVKWTDREKLLRITASGSDLRAFIANKSNLFVDLWKFEKE